MIMKHVLHRLIQTGNFLCGHMYLMAAKQTTDYSLTAVNRLFGLESSTIRIASKVRYFHNF